MAGQAEQNCARIWQQSMSSKLPSSTTAKMMKHKVTALEAQTVSIQTHRPPPFATSELLAPHVLARYVYWQVVATQRVPAAAESLNVFWSIDGILP
eukprot:2028060-Amphidinium_carterae.1